MSTCKNCGAILEEGVLECPNCGKKEAEEVGETAKTSVEETVSTAVDEIKAKADESVENVTENIPDPVKETVEDAVETAKETVQETVDTAKDSAEETMENSPLLNGGEYDPNAFQAVPNFDEVQPKKKKKTWLYILIPVIIVVVLILALLGGCFIYGYVSSKKATNMMDDYLTAYANGDAETISTMVPDSYWDYVEENYSYTKDQAVLALDYYLDEYSESLGGSTQVDYTVTSTDYSLNNSTIKDSAKEIAENYGTNCKFAVALNTTATFTGASDTDEQEFTFLMIKSSDGNFTSCAVNDFEDVISSGYVETAEFDAECGTKINEFWNSFLTADAESLATQVPEQFWDYMSTNFGVEQADAVSALDSYLKEGLSFDYDNCTVSVEIGDCTEYDEDALENYNSGLEEYGLGASSMTEVATSIVISVEGEEDLTDDTSVLLTKIDEDWYCYDLMYYFVMACSYTSTDSAE